MGATVFALVRSLALWLWRSSARRAIIARIRCATLKPSLQVARYRYRVSRGIGRRRGRYADLVSGQWSWSAWLRGLLSDNPNPNPMRRTSVRLTWCATCNRAVLCSVLSSPVRWRWGAGRCALDCGVLWPMASGQWARLSARTRSGARGGGLGVAHLSNQGALKAVVSSEIPSCAGPVGRREGEGKAQKIALTRARRSTKRVREEVPQRSPPTPKRELKASHQQQGRTHIHSFTHTRTRTCARGTRAPILLSASRSRANARHGHGHGRARLEAPSQYVLAARPVRAAGRAAPRWMLLPRHHPLSSERGRQVPQFVGESRRALLDHPHLVEHLVLPAEGRVCRVELHA
eukprot:scaffold10429_cov122-Isochrysis_galbana.AAC.9